MANPMLSKKADVFFTATTKIKRLFQEVYREQNKKEKSDDEVPRIKVSELVSKMSFYYEKLRNMIDYKEEYLLRKNAIERILRRHILIEDKISIKDLNSSEVARHLLVELIRAAYLPNNSVPETKIEEIGKIIDKYLLLRKYSFEYLKEKSSINNDTKRDLTRWIISLAATDVEENLGKSGVDKVVVDYMYDILTRYVVLPDHSDYEKDKDIQIYVGIHRNYLNFDNDMLSFILFKYYTDNWKNPSIEEIKAASKHILRMKEVIDNQLVHPLTGQMNRLINRYTVFFTILLDVIEENPVNVYDSFIKDPKSFPRLVKKMCAKRYLIARKKLRWSAFRSIVYIFATKLVLVLLLEIPVIQFLGSEVDFNSLIINVSFPPVLLLFIVMFTRMPSEANTAKIIEGVEEITFIEKERKDFFKLRRPVERTSFLNAFFGFFYTVTFFLTFGAIIWGLRAIDFNVVSIIIFLFFLALISFFSIRIKRGIKQLIILPPRENIFSFILDFFYVPIIQVGKWLNEKFDKINVFVLILDVLIEAPFKFFVDITEEWTKYVKERKDEIV